MGSATAPNDEKQIREFVVMVRSFVDELFLDASITKMQADPSPENRRAIRCYARAGFVAQDEVTTPDGRVLLMVQKRP